MSIEIGDQFCDMDLYPFRSYDQIQFTADTFDRTWNNVAHIETETYCATGITLYPTQRLLSGDEEQLEVNQYNSAADVLRYNSGLDRISGKQYTAFKKSMQTWFGEYTVPNNLFVSLVDESTGMDAFKTAMEEGEYVAIMGPSGCGKSTLLNAVTQPANLDSGKVEVDGINSQKYESKFHFFYVPDSKEMFLNLTGNEYLKCIIQLYRQDVVKSDETLKKLSIAFKLDRSLNEYIANYSLGMKQKVYLMAAFLSGAGNLILDEPFNGLDPESVAMLKNLLSEYRDRGNLVLFSIHNLDLVANFCDDIVFIDKQRKVFQTENPKDFKQLEDVFFQKCV